MPKRSRLARRQAIAVAAARIIVEEGQRDYGQAKLKAASRLGYTGEGDLPRNTEIESAVRQHIELFGDDSLGKRLQTLRQAAVEAMEFFASFSPRLVGAVLAGTADAHSAVSLHLFADSPEQVAQYLMDQRVPYDEDSRTVRVNRDNTSTLPAFKFQAGEVPFDITVFDRGSIRQAPLSPIDGRPMERANRNAVDALLR